MNSITKWATPTTPANMLERLNFKQIAEVANALSKKVEDPNRDYLGCILSMAYFDRNSASKHRVASCTIGEPGEDILLFDYHAPEKIRRLRKRWERGYMESTSRPSADSSNPDENKRTYAGCEIFLYGSEGLIYISISGYPEDVDEAIVYAIGIHCGFPPMEILKSELIDEAVSRLTGVISR